jgi:hypothetical protein
MYAVWTPTLASHARLLARSSQGLALPCEEFNLPPRGNDLFRFMVFRRHGQSS